MRTDGRRRNPGNILHRLETILGEYDIQESHQLLLLDLFQAKEFQREFGVYQTPSMRFTSVVRTKEGLPRHGIFDLVRAEHSLDVLIETLELCRSFGLDSYGTAVASVVALDHDWGHPAFAHNGEEVIRNLGFTSFDHDFQGLILHSQPLIKERLAQAGIDPLDVMACFAGEDILKEGSREELQEMRHELRRRGLPWELELNPGTDAHARLVQYWAPVSRMVQDWADIFAYIKTDWWYTGVYQGKARKAAESIASVRAAFSIKPGEGIVLDDPLNFMKALRHLMHYHRDFACSARAAISNRLLTSAIAAADVSIEDIISGQDDAIIARMRHEDRERFRKGADLFYCPGLLITTHEIPQAPPCNYRQLARTLGTQLGGECVVSPTPGLKKQFEVRLSERAVSFADRMLGSWKGAPAEPFALENRYDGDNFQIALTRPARNRLTIDCLAQQAVVVGLRSRIRGADRLAMLESAANIVQHCLDREGCADGLTIRTYPDSATTPMRDALRQG